jgi:hypothetical protein
MPDYLEIRMKKILQNNFEFVSYLHKVVWSLVAEKEFKRGYCMITDVALIRGEIFAKQQTCLNA